MNYSLNHFIRQNLAEGYYYGITSSEEYLVVLSGNKKGVYFLLKDVPSRAHILSKLSNEKAKISEKLNCIISGLCFIGFTKE